MKNNTSFKLFIILILAFLLRILFLDKPEGLWNDEYTGWFIASQKNLNLFFISMIRNCHTPLYFLYLKLWMFFFSDSDISLRYSSVVPSALSIIIMYYTGRELKNEKLGLLCAFTTAVSSFLIYFAQEVRLYSLMFFFSSLLLLYTIKVLKCPNKNDLILMFIFSALIVFTHTLGIMYVFLIITFTLYFILNNIDEKQKKFIITKILMYFLIPITAVIIIISPFLYNIITFDSLSQFWSGYNFSKILLTFTDYFSPVQLNIINTYDTISSYFFSEGKFNYTFILFAFIPAIIAFYGIYIALRNKNIKIVCLSLSALIFFIYLNIISYTGKMVLITKYSVEIYPTLILLMCYGLYKIKDKKLSRILIILYFVLNLTFLFTSENSAFRKTRPEGHRAVAELINNSRLKNGDYVLLTYYDKDKFDRYLNNNKNLKYYSINKFNFNYYLYKNPNYNQVIHNGKYMYKDKFRELPNKNIMDYSKYTFIDNMKKGERIGIIFLNNVSFMSNENIKEILSDEKQYKKTPFIFLVFSVIRNSIMYSLKDDYRIDSITYAGDWTLIVFKKKH